MSDNMEKLPFAPQLKEFIHLLKMEFPLDSVWIFGSFAKGTAGPASDLDVGVILGEEVDFQLEMTIFKMGKKINPKFESLTFSTQDFLREQFSIISTIKKDGFQVA